MLAPGDRIGNYEVVAHLRTGGMGALFLGMRHGVAGFVQPVAIKVVHPHLWEREELRDSFVSEALLASRIAHPNVVRVEELSESEGRYFIVMEYVHGFSISELMRTLSKRKRALSVEVATTIVMAAAAGLHAAHETKDDHGAPLELVHRDISPQNILIAFDGHVKITDFGIAKVARTERTTTGSLKGKIRYMSPEQAYGRALDRRSDVYSLGLVLWEMITRRRAFKKGDDLAVLDAVRQPSLLRPRELVPSVPPALDEAVMIALSIAPEDRFSTALDFSRSLGRAVPAAHIVDATRLAELLADAMGDEVRARAEVLPHALRTRMRFVTWPSIAAQELTVDLAPAVSSDEARAFVEDLSAPATGAPVELPPRRTAWWAALAVPIVLLLGWMWLGREEPKVVPAVNEALEPAERVEAPEPPAVEAPAEPIVDTPPPEPVVVEPPKKRPARRRAAPPSAPPPVEAPKPKPKAKPSTKDVDGVPLLEEPTF